MKTIKNIMIAAMVLFAGNAMAQTLSAPEVSIEPGGKANLVVSYDSEKEFTGVQFTVYLTGVEMELNSSFVYVSAVDEQQAGYEAAINDTQDETGQIVIIKRQSKRVPALKNGGLISLSLVADDSFEGGKAVIKEMAFSDKGDVTKVETPIEVNITVAGSDPTGINSLNAEDSNEPAFNLAGQKVSNNYKGIVVKNGKKAIVK